METYTEIFLEFIVIAALILIPAYIQGRRYDE